MSRYARPRRNRLGGFQRLNSPRPLGLESLEVRRLLAADINLVGNGVSIVNNDTTPSAADFTDYGNVQVAGAPLTRTFTIQNVGDEALTLNGTPLVSVGGTNAADFTVTTLPASTNIATAGNTTFQLRFTPSALGVRNATITIASTDPDESPYTFAIRGTGVSAPKIALSNLANVTIVNGDSTPSVAESTDFGTVNTALGTRTQTFAISNLGAGTLNLTGTPRVIVGGANAADFTITVLPPATIAPSTNQTFVVSFDPSGDGVRTATLTIANDDITGNPYTFDIRGTGAVVPPTSKIALSNFTGTGINSGDNTPSTADSTDFGVVDISAGLRTQTYAISNFGLASLNLTGTPRVALSGTNAADFTVLNQPNSPVAVNANTTFAIQFNPSATGVRSAAVTIASDDPTAASYTFAIQGTGGSQPEVVVSSFRTSAEIASGDITPGTGDDTNFGDADVTGGLVTRKFVLSNLGTAALNLSGTPRIGLSGANAGDFTVVSTPAGAIAANSNQTFEIQFNPSGTGVRTATVTIANDDADEGSYTFSIQGTGATLPEIALGNSTGVQISNGDTTPSAADSTDFGEVDELAGTIDQRFVITNFGGAALNLSGTPRVAISGAHADDFTVLTLPPATVGSAANTTFDVRFNPSATGVRTATVTIRNDDGDEGTYSFSVQGTGTRAANREITVTTASGASVFNGDTSTTHFGEATFGGAITTQFSIANFGTRTLSLTGTPRVTVVGPNAADFTVVRQPAASIDVNGSSTFDVTFQPIGLGERSATLSIATNDVDENPFTFTVRGTSTTYYLANAKVVDGGNNLILNGDTTPSADNQTSFGAVNVGSSLARTYTLQNEGAKSLSSVGVSIGGPNAADFSVTQQPATRVGAGGSSNFTVTFRPTAAGVRSATVTISSLGGNDETFTFDISGTGVSVTPSS